MHDSHIANVLVATSTIFAWVFTSLPSFAALASILWLGFQFYHSAQMKEWRAQRKKGKKK